MMFPFLYFGNEATGTWNDDTMFCSTFHGFEPGPNPFLRSFIPVNDPTAQPAPAQLH
jgi:hypothetical protein